MQEAAYKDDQTPDMFEEETTPTVRQSRTSKSAQAYRTISEVADELDVAAHVLRFWESKFKEIRPLKRSGGRRFYRPQDIALLRRIKTLLHEEGYTIRGVQAYLQKNKGEATVAQGQTVVAERQLVQQLREIRQVLAAG